MNNNHNNEYSGEMENKEKYNNEYSEEEEKSDKAKNNTQHLADAKKSNDGINYKTNRNRLFKECIPLAFFVTIAEYHTDATTRNDHNTNAKHPGKKKKSNDRNSNNANVKNRLF